MRTVRQAIHYATPIIHCIHYILFRIVMVNKKPNLYWMKQLARFVCVNLTVDFPLVYPLNNQYFSLFNMTRF